MDHNTIAVSGRMAFPRLASEEDCVNYIMQLTGNNASEAEYKCEKVIPHTPFTGDLNVSDKSK